VAGFGEQGGKVELEVFNPQGDDGKELPQVLMFYDDVFDVELALQGRAATSRPDQQPPERGTEES